MQENTGKIENCSTMAPCRESSKDVLGQMIKRLRYKADSLETIYNMLPTQLTPQQDEALWHIVGELRF